MSFAKDCIGFSVIQFVDTPKDAHACSVATCGRPLGPKCAMMAHAINEDGDLVEVAICMKCVKVFDNYVTGKWDWLTSRTVTFLAITAGWLLNIAQFIVVPFGVVALLDGDWRVLAWGCVVTGAARMIIQTLQRFES